MQHLSFLITNLNHQCKVQHQLNLIQLLQLLMQIQFSETNLCDPILHLLLPSVAICLLPWKLLNRDNNKQIYVIWSVDLSPPNIYRYYICSKVSITTVTLALLPQEAKAASALLFHNDFRQLHKHKSFQSEWEETAQFTVKNRTRSYNQVFYSMLTCVPWH